MIVLGACGVGVDGGVDGGLGTGTSALPTSTTDSTDDDPGPGESEAASSDGDVQSGDVDTGDAIFDVAGPSGEATSAGAEEFCTKVDFLFVIDNSSSMEDDQVRLLAAFGGFIDSIKATVNAQDYHIGVITTDDHYYDYDTYVDGNAPGSCDVLGGLVTENWDYQTNTQRVCTPFASGANYLSDDEPDLHAKFECTAFVDDEGGTDEKPFAAIEAALAMPPIDCNVGFVRDDALLVLILITDEDDDPEPGGNPGSGGDPTSWYQAVIAAKAGVAHNVVVLALAGTEDCPYEHTVRIEEFVGMFGDNGFVGAVCQDDYAAFFDASVPVVDDACNEFEPPG